MTAVRRCHIQIVVFTNKCEAGLTDTMYEGSSMSEPKELVNVQKLHGGGSHGLTSKRIVKVPGPPSERRTPRMLKSSVGITLITYSPSGGILRHFCKDILSHILSFEGKIHDVGGDFKSKIIDLVK